MNYFEVNERNDWKLLVDFNNHTHIFKELGQTPTYYHSDASGITQDGRTVSIELKKRNVVLTKSGSFSAATFKDDTLYIESHKMADLLLDKIDGYTPLYINFLDNNVVIVYNLIKLTVRPKTVKKIIKSNGYKMMEMGFRQGLSIKDAAIWKDNKLVKKQGEEWKTRESF